MAVVNEGQRGQSKQLFELAHDLELEAAGLLEKLEQVQDTLERLLAFEPEDPENLGAARRPDGP